MLLVRGVGMSVNEHPNNMAETITRLRAEVDALKMELIVKLHAIQIADSAISGFEAEVERLREHMKEHDVCHGLLIASNNQTKKAEAALRGDSPDTCSCGREASEAVGDAQQDHNVGCPMRGGESG